MPQRRRQTPRCAHRSRTRSNTMNGRQRGGRAWRASPQSLGSARRSMRRVNPAFIPRNHRIEQIIAAAVEGEDFGPFEEMLRVLSQPYEDQAASRPMQCRRSPPSGCCKRFAAPEPCSACRMTGNRSSPRRCGRIRSRPAELAEYPLPAAVDVLIVGAGYTGLSAARETAAAGRTHAGARCRRSGRRLLRPQRRPGRLQHQTVAREFERALRREARLCDLPRGSRSGRATCARLPRAKAWIAIGASAGASSARIPRGTSRSWRERRATASGPRAAHHGRAAGRTAAGNRERFLSRRLRVPR